MAVSSVTAAPSAAAQQLEQARQASAREAAEIRAAEAAAEQRQEPQANQEAPRPVVNAQGQTTGQVVNTVA